ncbi:amino acid adenylation domain-containing protein [Bacillus sp. ISL-53]|nr:amino acid adenylation domain-containing protein [Bacillus sp. ISL-53]
MNNVPNNGNDISYKNVSPWNETNLDLPLHLQANQIIEEVSSLFPERIAVEYKDQKLSYRELNQQVDQLTRYLMECGVGGDISVAVYMERTPTLIISLLSIWRSGASYVPLDPYFPKERLQYMLENSQASFLLSDLDTPIFLDGEGLRVIDLRQGIPSTDSVKLLSSMIPPEGKAAYTIYTSGSTGRPKGIQISHRSVTNFLLAMAKQTQISKEDRLLSVASYTFDISVMEYFMPLIVGGTVILVDNVTASDGIQLASVLDKSRPTMMEATPSTWQMLLTAGWKGNKELKIYCGGERWTRELANELLARCKEVWNVYGPTETTVWTSAYRVSEQTKPIKIGRPIQNYTMYVLDNNKKPVSVGVLGELYIGGEGVADGYLGLPDLTKTSFFDDPFRNQGKMFRTGDLARFDQDGILECLGRIDHQVKIRGYRIELTEIENVLSQLKEIREIAVVAQSESNGEKRLVAFIVGNQEFPLPNNRELREYCRRFLPAYMVPTNFVEIEKLPLTPNGKVNRTYLTNEFVLSMENDAENKILPRNDSENKLAIIWSDILGVKQLGVYDNFFDIGGQSLLATKLMVRIQQEFKITLSLPVIFKNPTINSLTKYILSQSSKEKWNQETTITTSMEKTTLSYAQKRMWFLNELINEKALYNVPYAVQITGDLQNDILENCIHEIVSRHEVLRTTFVSSNGYPVIKVGDSKISYTYNDLTHLCYSEKQNSIQTLLAQLVHMPFNLCRAPLFHVTLIRLDTQKYILGLVMHHIICDGWSIDIFMEEMFSLYKSKIGNSVIGLVNLPIQYSDYANWEQAQIEGGLLEKDIQYWKEQLKGHDSFLRLPVDYVRPKIPSYEGAVHRFGLSTDLTKNIKTLGNLHGCSPYMTLLAAFEILCYQHSGQTDFLIGTPISNRNHIEVEKLIGFFVNTLVMRAKLTSGQTFLEVLNNVRKVALEAYEHQEVPFDKLVEAIQPERDFGNTPLFQVMFQLAPENNINITDFEVEEIQLEATTSKFDLSLNIVEKNNEFICEFIYRTELFKAERIQQFALHFKTLLESITENPETVVSQLSMIQKYEEKSLIISSSEQPSQPLYDSNVIKLFEEQVEKTPNLPAIKYEDTYLSYRELNTRANQLAHYLQRQGVCEETFVGLCMQRSTEMFVALLGIGKAGGAYVPLDSEMPLERLIYQINDSKPAIVLTDQLHVYNALSDIRRIIYLNDDEFKLHIENQPLTNPNTNLKMNNAMYLIYTSGSTGKPKGVVVEHGNLLNYLNGTKDTVSLGAEAGYALVSTLAADLGNTMIFHSLISGGVLHVIGKGRISDPDSLSEYFRQNKIDCLKIVPSHLHALLSGLSPEGVLPNCQIIFGGEPLYWKLVDQVWKLNPNCEIVNHYGPTETTIGVATYRIHRDTPRLSSTVPLGFPIGDVEFYILNDFLNFVPEGVKGELYVGGLSVSRGYFGKEDLNTQQFIEFSNSQTKNKRLYRTGDIVRQLPNGSIEYLGRKDEQVKIRGYRIELNEVLTVYQNHPDIRSALVIMEDDLEKPQSLACYVFFQKNKTLSVGELFRYGMERLPSYMIPTSFYILDKVPLTINGKVDREAISAKRMRMETIEEGNLKQLLSTDEERILLIWSDLFNRSSMEISLHDNFFSLGGHSLLATHLISRIRKEWQAPVPLSLIFEYPTISGLAREVSKFTTKLCKPPFEKVTIDHNKPQILSYAQQRLWFIDQLESNSALYNVPKIIHMQGLLDVDLFVKSLKEVVNRHHILRTTYQEIGGHPRQKILNSTDFPITVLDWRNQLHSDEHLIKTYLTEEAKKPFELRRGPMVKAHLIRTGNQEYWFMLNFHHITTDAWSIRIVLQEIEDLYQMYLKKDIPISLNDPTQYSNFSIWERLWLNSEYIEDQYVYWEKQLRGANPYVSLPTNNSRPESLSKKGATEYISVPKGLSQDIISFSRDKGGSLFITTLSAFGIILYMLNEKEDFCIGTPIANRTDTETEKIVGFFVNTLVLRMNLSSNPTFEELLSRVKQTTMEAYANQEIPFDKLVERLVEKRDPIHSPFFQIFFETSQDLSLKLPGVKSTSENIDLELAKFDLSVNFIEKFDHFVIEVEYNTELYEKETILKYINNYLELLQKVIERPDLRLKEICQLQSLVSQEDLDELWK